MDGGNSSSGMAAQGRITVPAGMPVRADSRIAPAVWRGWTEARRLLLSDNDLAAIQTALDGGLEIEMTQNWNKRYRENMLKIKSGNLLEVAAVVKGLMKRDKERGLSTGERKMLHSAKQILISEIVLSESASYEEVEERLNSALICS